MRFIYLHYIYEYMKMDIKERFLRHVNKTKNCWLWTGQLSPNGYGILSATEWGNSAHRISWNIFKGKIDGELLVLHKCDVKTCVNPDHLFLGTHKDNSNDKVAKNRTIRGDKVKGSKLTEQKVLEIRNSNECWNVLANRYGVSPQTIYEVKAKKTWAWLGATENSCAGGTTPSVAGGSPRI